MKRRMLSPDERALWRRATRNVRRHDGAAEVPGTPGLKLGETSREAMFPTKSSFRNSPSSFVTPSPLHPEEPRSRVTKDEREKALRMKANFETRSGTAGRHTSSVFASGDPALERRARRGRVRPERVIDLHGMTQVAARVALVSFVDAARRDGCRCVLVVTGKGARAPERDYAAESAPRGVIRRRFQDWLDEEPLRAMIARAAPAAPKDGGAGAFYVFLKSKSAQL